MKWIITITLLTINLCLQGPELFDEEKEKVVLEIYKREQFLQSLDTMEFSIDNLHKAMIYLEIRQAEILVKQAILETGNFTSHLWITYHNPFGMKHPRVRNTTSTGPVTNMKYAGYNHWSDSVKDMAYFQQWYIDRGWDMDCIYEYKRFLLALYAEDRNYVNKLIQIST